MKQQRLADYRPNYPRKALRGAALTAAALMALGGAAGCQKAKDPGLELQTEGIVAISEPTDAPVPATEPPEEVLVLDGEVTIPEPEETPSIEELTTTGMIYMPEENGQN